MSARHVSLRSKYTGTSRILFKNVQSPLRVMSPFAEIHWHFRILFPLIWKNNAKAHLLREEEVAEKSSRTLKTNHYLYIASGCMSTSDAFYIYRQEWAMYTGPLPHPASILFTVESSSTH